MRVLRLPFLQFVEHSPRDACDLFVVRFKRCGTAPRPVRRQILRGQEGTVIACSVSPAPICCTFDFGWRPFPVRKPRNRNAGAKSFGDSAE